MSKKTEEEILIGLLKKAADSVGQKNGPISEEHHNFIGYCLGYFLKAIKNKQKKFDVDFRKVWIDDVSWENFELARPNRFVGSGKLWWGFRKDYSILQQNGFYGEMEIKERSGKTHLSYLFRFQMNGKKYELIK